MESGYNREEYESSVEKNNSYRSIVFASEILKDKKLLTILLKLRIPRTAKELVDSYVYVEKKLIVKRERGYGIGEIEKKAVFVEEKLPESTMYRVLKKLREKGIVLVEKGLDSRRKYYSLSDIGRKVYDIVAETLREALKKRMRTTEKEADRLHNKYEVILRRYKGYVMRIEELDEIIKKEIGISPRLVIEAVKPQILNIGNYKYYWFEE